MCHTIQVKTTVLTRILHFMQTQNICCEINKNIMELKKFEIQVEGYKYRFKTTGHTGLAARRKIAAFLRIPIQKCRVYRQPIVMKVREIEPLPYSGGDL